MVWAAELLFVLKLFSMLVGPCSLTEFGLKLWRDAQLGLPMHSAPQNDSWPMPTSQFRGEKKTLLKVFGYKLILRTLIYARAREPGGKHLQYQERTRTCGLKDIQSYLENIDFTTNRVQSLDIVFHLENIDLVPHRVHLHSPRGHPPNPPECGFSAWFLVCTRAGRVTW